MTGEENEEEVFCLFSSCFFLQASSSSLPAVLGSRVWVRDALGRAVYDDYHNYDGTTNPMNTTNFSRMRISEVEEESGGDLIPEYDNSSTFKIAIGMDHMAISRQAPHIDSAYYMYSGSSTAAEFVVVGVSYVVLVATTIFWPSSDFIVDGMGDGWVGVIVVHC